MSGEASRVLQDLRRSVVMVRSREVDAVHEGEKDSKHGTAFVVDRKRGLLVTAAHVIEAVAKECTLGTEVTLQIPSESRGLATFLEASVVVRGEGTDDVAMLALTRCSFPTFVEEVKLGSAAGSKMHRFLTYGFRNFKMSWGMPGCGVILGPVLLEPGSLGTAATLVITSQHLAAGMSGAPILDESRNLVVGILKESAQHSSYSSRDRDSGLAVDAVVLSKEPFNLPLADNPSWENASAAVGGTSNARPLGPVQVPRTKSNKSVTPFAAPSHSVGPTVTPPPTEQLQQFLSLWNRYKTHLADYEDWVPYGHVPVIIENNGDSTIDSYAIQTPLVIDTRNYQYHVYWGTKSPTYWGSYSPYGGPYQLFYRRDISVCIRHSGGLIEAYYKENNGGDSFQIEPLAVHLYKK